MNELYLKNLKNKNILITGGAGFIGSNLAQECVNLEANVIVVDNLHQRCGGNKLNLMEIENKIKFIISDISNEEVILPLLKDCDIIFNLASSRGHIESLKDPLLDLELNCKSQISFLEAWRKSGSKAKVILAGSRTQYGTTEYLPIDERHNLNETEIYSIHKSTVEKYHFVYAKSYGLKTCSLRLTNTFGVNQLAKDTSQGFIPWFIRSAIEDKDITIFGDGAQLRDANYVSDVVGAFLSCAYSERANGHIYNLGSSEVLSISDFARLIINVVGKGRLKLVPWPEDKKRIEAGDVYCNFGKIHIHMGWSPKVSLREGIERTVEFYEKNKKNYW